MPWIVGIDEAGYGPNLGPFVQVAVSLLLPTKDLAGWKTLADRIRQTGTEKDTRPVVDDSKKVFGQAKRLSSLAAAMPLVLETVPYTLNDWLSHQVKQPSPREDWWNLNGVLPQENKAIVRLSEAGPVALNMITTADFNNTIHRKGSKGAIPGEGVSVLAAAMAAKIPGEEPIHFLCDKLGGRNEYGGIVSEAFPDSWPIADRESAAESRYRLLNLPREITFTFKPRADGDSVSVALASMLAKYTREVMMEQFNTYWAERVPGLKPTAGYPLDAKRFYEEIRPAMEAEGWHEEFIWRIR